MKTKIIGIISICMLVTYIGLTAQEKTFKDLIIFKDGRAYNGVHVYVNPDSLIVTKMTGEEETYTKKEVAEVMKRTFNPDRGFTDTVIMRDGTVMEKTQVFVTRDQVIVTLENYDAKIYKKSEVSEVKKPKRKSPEELAEDLVNSIISGNVEGVKAAIQGGAEINKADENGTTPLIWAATYGRANIIELLGKKEAKVNQADRSGWTPLHWAANNGYKEAVQALLTLKAKDGKDKEGKLAVDVAANDEIRKLLGWKPKEIKFTGKTVTDAIGMTFVQIPAGEFMMGCSTGDSECYSWENPAHKVKISQPFYMGKQEVTQAQWRAVMGSDPSYFKGCDNCPVEQVSWNDIQEFLNKLNSTTVGNGRDRSGKYRLPTEAEWEYAARAGSTTKYYWGNEINDEFLWYSNNSSSKTHPVGEKKPNAFGLHDMLGNVWEWCEDWYGEYSNPGNVSGGVEVDPKGASSGSRRVYRGGSWLDSSGYARSSTRISWRPDDGGDRLGFRLVLAP